MKWVADAFSFVKKHNNNNLWIEYIIWYIYLLTNIYIPQGTKYSLKEYALNLR